MSAAGMAGPSLVTIECSQPRERYTLFKSGPSLVLHLAGPRNGGTGPCICGFDRFAKDVGFSVGGGTTGPGVHHEACPECARLAGEASIHGTHAARFAAAIAERAS